jgi:AraC-like DNA-binding protein
VRPTAPPITVGLKANGFAPIASSSRRDIVPLAAVADLDWSPGQSSRGRPAHPRAGDAGAQHLLVPSRAVLKLLGDGLRALEDDQMAARWCLVRARGLLQEVVDAGDRPVKVETERDDRGGLLPWQMRLVMRHIEAHLDANLSIADLASLARLSRQYFAHAFRRSFGSGPHAYVVGQRIARAQELMLVSDEPLSRIALDCGFSDQPHFTRVFRGVVGETPRAWQRRHLPAKAKPRGRQRLPDHREPESALNFLGR